MGIKTIISQMNVDFGIGIYGFLGPNGAGKSTLFRMLSTVEKPEAGEISYQGEDIFGWVKATGRS